MNKNKAKKMFREETTRSITGEGIEEFVRVCNTWSKFLIREIEKNMEGNKRIFAKDVTAAFADFILRGD